MGNSQRFLQKRVEKEEKRRDRGSESSPERAMVSTPLESFEILQKLSKLKATLPRRTEEP